eukprot:jgi/Botrbrau1/546/Bobra.0010s0021.1
MSLPLRRPLSFRRAAAEAKFKRESTQDHDIRVFQAAVSAAEFVGLPPDALGSYNKDWEAVSLSVCGICSLLLRSGTIYEIARLRHIICTRGLDNSWRTHTKQVQQRCEIVARSIAAAVRDLKRCKCQDGVGATDSPATINKSSGSPQAE